MSGRISNHWDMMLPSLLRGIYVYHQVLHDLMLAPQNENTDLVMPAWIAGIQARKDASGDIHVDLDSSNPCWNDTIEGARLEPTAARCSKRSRRFRIVNLNFVPSSTGQALRSYRS